MCRLAQQRTSERSLLLYQDVSFIFDWQSTTPVILITSDVLCIWTQVGKRSFVNLKVLQISLNIHIFICIHIIYLQVYFLYIYCLYIWKSHFGGKKCHQVQEKIVNNTNVNLHNFEEHKCEISFNDKGVFSGENI